MARPAILLIVDDDPLVIRSLARALSSMSYDVIVSDSAKEALILVGTIGPEVKLVALVDIGLPDKNGLELARALDRIRPNTRCLFMTGDLPQKGEEHRTFMKPFNVLELRLRIVRELGI